MMDRFAKSVNKFKVWAVIIGIIIIIAIITPFAFKWKTMQKSFKHSISSTIGLNRKIIEQDYNRNPVKEWTGRFNIEMTPSGISFIDNDGNEIKISPPYRVEEAS